MIRRRASTSATNNGDTIDGLKQKYIKQNKEIIHKNSELMKQVSELTSRIRELQQEQIALKSDNFQLTQTSFKLEMDMANLKEVLRKEREKSAALSRERSSAGLDDGKLVMLRRMLRDMQDIVSPESLKGSPSSVPFPRSVSPESPTKRSPSPHGTSRSSPTSSLINVAPSIAANSTASVATRPMPRRNSSASLRRNTISSRPDLSYISEGSTGGESEDEKESHGGYGNGRELLEGLREESSQPTQSESPRKRKTSPLSINTFVSTSNAERPSDSPTRSEDEGRDLLNLPTNVSTRRSARDVARSRRMSALLTNGLPDPAPASASEAERPRSSASSMSSSASNDSLHSNASTTSSANSSDFDALPYIPTNDNQTRSRSRTDGTSKAEDGSLAAEMEAAAAATTSSIPRRRSGRLSTSELQTASSSVTDRRSISSRRQIVARPLVNPVEDSDSDDEKNGPGKLSSRHPRPNTGLSDAETSTRKRSASNTWLEREQSSQGSSTTDSQTGASQSQSQYSQADTTLTVPDPDSQRTYEQELDVTSAKAEDRDEGSENDSGSSSSTNGTVAATARKFEDLTHRLNVSRTTATTTAEEGIDGKGPRRVKRAVEEMETLSEEGRDSRNGNITSPMVASIVASIDDAASREARRARKPVNYALPSLRAKMRQPEGYVSALKSTSRASTSSSISRTSSASRRSASGTNSGHSTPTPGSGHNRLLSRSTDGSTDDDDTMTMRRPSSATGFASSSSPTREEYGSISGSTSSTSLRQQQSASTLGRSSPSLSTRLRGPDVTNLSSTSSKVLLQMEETRRREYEKAENSESEQTGRRVPRRHSVSAI